MRYSREMQKLVSRMAKDRGLDLAKLGTHFRAESGAFMDLVVENVSHTTSETRVSVAHYCEQNGDLLADPDIVFMVGCDGEWYAVEWTTPAVGRFGGYSRYVETDGKGSWLRANMKGQRDLGIFANKWAKNLKVQGFS